MAGSRSEVAQHVLGHFRTRWPQAIEATELRKHLLLKDPQILDIGAYFNGWRGIFLTPLEVLACVTVGDLVTLIWSKLSRVRSAKKIGPKRAKKKKRVDR